MLKQTIGSSKNNQLGPAISDENFSVLYLEMLGIQYGTFCMQAGALPLTDSPSQKEALQGLLYGDVGVISCMTKSSRTISFNLMMPEKIPRVKMWWDINR